MPWMQACPNCPGLASGVRGVDCGLGGHTLYIMNAMSNHTFGDNNQ